MTTTDEGGIPPAQPIISPDICVCRNGSIAICVPIYTPGGPASEASKIDTYGYKYKTPEDMEWKKVNVDINQVGFAIEETKALFTTERTFFWIVRFLASFQFFGIAYVCISS